MKKNIEHKVFFSQSPEEVWAYLTDSDLIALWLMKNDFKPVAGHQFRFWTKPLPQFNFDGIAYCEVLEVTPFSKLSYSWKGGPGDGVMTLDSIVVWTLLPKENGTELQLVHSGFEEKESMMLMFMAMNEGWLRNMKKIGELLNEKENDTARS